MQHARRLFPLQISLKATIEWAYQNLDSEEWFVVDKSVLETSDVPEGLEKMIGFEGRPDPSSGKSFGVNDAPCHLVFLCPLTHLTLY